MSPGRLAGASLGDVEAAHAGLLEADLRDSRLFLRWSIAGFVLAPVSVGLATTPEGWLYAQALGILGILATGAVGFYIRWRFLTERIELMDQAQSWWVMVGSGQRAFEWRLVQAGDDLGLGGRRVLWAVRGWWALAVLTVAILMALEPAS